MSKSSAKVQSITSTTNKPVWSWLKHSQSASEAFKQRNRHQARWNQEFKASTISNNTSQLEFKVSKLTWSRTFNYPKFLTIWFYYQLVTWWTSAKQLLLIFKCIFNMHMKWLSFFNWSRNFKEMGYNKRVMFPSLSSIQMMKKMLIPSYWSNQLQLSKWSLIQFNFLPNQSSSHGKKSKVTKIDEA